MWYYFVLFALALIQHNDRCAPFCPHYMHWNITLAVFCYNMNDTSVSGCVCVRELKWTTITMTLIRRAGKKRFVKYFMVRGVASWGMYYPNNIFFIFQKRVQRTQYTYELLYTSWSSNSTVRMPEVILLYARMFHF